jgi:hypothetical protein
VVVVAAGGALFFGLLAVVVVALDLADLSGERLEAGEEAAVVVPEAREGCGAVLDEVSGGDVDGGVVCGVVVGGAGDAFVGREWGGGGLAEGGGEDLAFELGDLVELPGAEGELVEEVVLEGGGGVEFFVELVAADGEVAALGEVGG